MSQSLSSLYEPIMRQALTPIASALKSHLEDILSDVERIDNISTRAKSIERFAAKAAKTHEDGTPRYGNPLAQIQDQIGARITVLYLTDVQNVKLAVRRYFQAIEWQEKRPERDEEFGYFGEHFILKLPDDVIPDGVDNAPEFFELQIKTLFQHAWSEASHDIGYKAPRKLKPLEVRQMAFSAAQAWGADQIFQELAQSIVPDNDV